jgi:copper homeostasis protein
MNTPELEICAFSAEAAQHAQNAGANRIELCSAYSEGGLTPSAGTIRIARKLLNIECCIMIRPRGGDFCYTPIEIDQMHFDIEHAKNAGADGVVLGVLQPNGHINIIRTREMVQHAAPLKVTFHRAFDMTADPLRAIDDLLICGCSRILTSGQKATAIQGIETIRKIVTHAGGKIQIMAGSGVTPQNAPQLMHAGVHALHLSAKKIIPGKMTWRNPQAPIMQTTNLTDHELLAIDDSKIHQMIETIRKTVKRKFYLPLQP